MRQFISYVLSNLLALLLLTEPISFIGRARGYITSTNPENNAFISKGHSVVTYLDPAPASASDYSERGYASYGFQTQISYGLNPTQSYKNYAAQPSNFYKYKPRRLILLTNDRHTSYFHDAKPDQISHLPGISSQKSVKHGRSRSNHHRPGLHLLHNITTKRPSTETQRTVQPTPPVSSTSIATIPTTTTTNVLTSSTISSSTAATTTNVLTSSTISSSTAATTTNVLTSSTISSSTAASDSISNDEPTSPSTTISLTEAVTTPCSAPSIVSARTIDHLADAADNLGGFFPDRVVIHLGPYPNMFWDDRVIQVGIDSNGVTGARPVSAYICGYDLGAGDQLTLFFNDLSGITTLFTGSGGPEGPIHSKIPAATMVFSLKSDCSEPGQGYTAVVCVGDATPSTGSCSDIANSCPTTAATTTAAA